MKYTKSAFATFLFAVLFCTLSTAQNKEIDSLKSLLETANDTTQVNVLRRLGVNFRFIDKATSLEYSSQSLEKAKKIGFQKGEIMALYSLGITHGMTDDYASSLQYLNNCLALANENQDYSTIYDVYSTKGIVYKRIGDYTTSKDYYLKSLKLADSFELEKNISSVHINLGILYDLMGEQENAITSYEKALNEYTGPDLETMQFRVKANLAVMDLSNEEYEAALSKFLEIQPIAEKLKDNISLCQIYSNIGLCYLNLEQWNLSLEYLTSALDLAKQLSLKQEVAVTYNHLANLMLRQKKYARAIDFSKKNLESLNQIMGQYEHKQKAHDLAYQIYEAKGELPKAIYHLNQNMAYGDSLLNETKVKEIQNLQIKHEVYIKDNEIRENELQMALLNSNIKANNKRIIYLSIIAILLLLSAGLLFLGLRNKIQSNNQLRDKTVLISEQKEVIEQMNTELEKRMLRAQMNPHFIFNSLNSIQHLINSNDRVNALRYLTKFSKLLRQVLESSINVNLPLKEEIELLKIYLELESLRFDNSFAYSIHIDDHLDVNEHEVPMLLVQPYIENAIIHGLMPKDGPKELSISFNDKTEYVECIIEDNGVGIKSKSGQKKDKRPSRGMSITEKRIASLEKFSSQNLLTIESLNNHGETGTRVTILIPKEQSPVHSKSAKKVV